MFSIYKKIIKIIKYLIAVLILIVLIILHINSGNESIKLISFLLIIPFILILLLFLFNSIIDMKAFSIANSTKPFDCPNCKSTKSLVATRRSGFFFRICNKCGYEIYISELPFN